MKFVLSIPVLTEDTRHRVLQQVFSIIRTYLSVFREDDDCRLCLYAEPQSFQNYTLEDALSECIAQERRLHDATGKVEVLSAGSTEASDETAHRLEIGQAVTADDLFRIFRDAGRRLDSAYELELATDMYDADIIAMAKTEGTVFGSSLPKSYAPHLSYVTDPEFKVKSVIDVGCGAGMFYDLLRRHSLLNGTRLPLYYGIDFSRSQIERARRKYPHAVFQQGDAADLPFPDKTFDFAVAWSVFGFMPRDRVAAAIEEVLRISRQGLITTVSCTSDDLLFPGPGEAEFNYWGSEYPLYTAQPDLADVLNACSSTSTVDVEVQDILMLVMPSGLDRRLTAENEDFSYLMEYLRQVVSLLTPKYGDAASIPRDEVTALMRQGGSLQSPDGKAFEIGPGHFWQQYKEVSITPKGWRREKQMALTPEYETLKVVT